MADDNLVYILDNKVYINLTNRCTNSCVFCLRQDKDDVCGQNMWLRNEDYPVEDVINQLKKYSDLISSGVTFCGYGEPTIKFEYLKTIAKYIKEKYPDTLIKVNTNGHGNIVNKKNILAELIGLVDEFSISLNAQNSKLYDEMCLPKIKNAYETMLEFAKESVKLGFKTTLSIVSGYKNYPVNIEECKNITENIGANFRNREWIPNGYS